METLQQDKVKNCPVTFTPSAMEELKRIITKHNIDIQTMALRVGVKGGGCSGMTYILGFDHKQDGDEQYTYNEIPVIMNRAQGMYIIGMQIDWVNGLNNRGFQYNNPNANNTCGCGTSFSV